ncbi:MAG: sugar phosphate isomerase/epimerase [Ruminococcus sp.]|nr:sugar phosphate isomerase/epimerase [Ruminococcus sp.]
MIAGVSTACLFPKPLEESLYDLAVNGISSVEIFVNTHSELKKSFACGIRDTLRRFETRCLAVHPFTCEMETNMLFSEYERRVEDMLEYYKLYFQFANIVGADTFVFHGGKGGPNTPREHFCERYYRLYSLGKQFGVTVALENVARCLSGLSSFIKDVSAILGADCAFVVDTKQAIRAGENPFAVLEAAGSRIVHVHISDSGEMGDCLPIGKGRFQIKRFLSRVHELNPECGAVLELYRSGFRGISDLVTSFNVLNRIIESLG